MIRISSRFLCFYREIRIAGNVSEQEEAKQSLSLRPKKTGMDAASRYRA